MKIKILLLVILYAGISSCKKDTADDAVPVESPVNSAPETPPALITTAYLLVIKANADTARSDTVTIADN